MINPVGLEWKLLIVCVICYPHENDLTVIRSSAESVGTHSAAILSFHTRNNRCKEAKSTRR